jgi:hypothetical protein
LALLSDVVPVLEWGGFMREFPPYVGDWNILDWYEVRPAQARRRFLDFWENVKT